MPDQDTDDLDRVDADTVIPVLHETAVVSKRQVETGRVKVHVTVHEHDETVRMLLRRQDATVERVPIGTVVESAPALRREGDVVIVPILEEVLVTEKRLVLREELRIRIGEATLPQEQVVRLRREEAEIIHDHQP